MSATVTMSSITSTPAGAVVKTYGSGKLIERYDILGCVVFSTPLAPDPMMQAQEHYRKEGQAACLWP
jgi:hypothetical protein